MTYYYSTGHEMTIHFQSDGSVTDRGFQASYETHNGKGSAFLGDVQFFSLCDTWAPVFAC